MKSKEQCYQDATLKSLSENANGTRMDIIYSAMEEYASQFKSQPLQSKGAGADDEIKKMAETFASTCFTKDSFRWQKVVQYYTKGVNDWLLKRMQEELHNAEEKPPYSMPTPAQEPFQSPSIQEGEESYSLEELKEENRQLKDFIKYIKDVFNSNEIQIDKLPKPKQ